MSAEDGGERRGGQPEPIAAILSRYMRGVQPSPRRARSGIAAAWQTICGPELAEETHAASLRKGVLTVEVRSNALLSELAGFRRDDLLGRLLEADTTGRIRGLRFRLGVF